MESSELLFKGLAVLHGITGLLLFGISTHEDLQDPAFYARRNPLAGDITKFLAVSSGCSLVACGLLAFIVPLFAVIAAWLSVALHLVGSLFGAATRGDAQHLVRPVLASLATRTIAAGALTVVFWRGWAG